jgi:hypothetical protein
LIEEVFEYWDKDVVKKTMAKETRASDIWSEVVDDAIDRAKEEL